MKTHHALALTLLLALLAFGQAGCSASNPFTFPGGGGTNSKAGTIGLDFSLLPDAPPVKIEPDAEFQVIAKIENFGEIPTTGELCVEDTVDDIYGGIGKNCEIFSIASASQDKGKVVPRSEIISLPSEGSSFMYRGLDSQPTTISTSILYQYSTDFSQVICVKDPLKQTTTSCKTSESISSKVKAPLGISSIEKNVFRISDGQVKLSVKINLKKQVNGKLLLPGAVSGFNEEAVNKVFVNDVSFGPYSLECDTDGSTLEVLTERVLRCTGVINSEGVIAHPLRIKLDYTVEAVKTHTLFVESEDKQR
ncbi:MAG TPA: hypothetical protein HA282_05690 [Nanoarchaeota archaeon]|nr:MAG: hypothetical protein QT01_C0001G0091 [archaeon GW2011_AR6]MBS3082577.1 hypothetical protein [Candidatus Pacearchaeota archaeon]HIH17462.1 hypothetical protein [Nanoarchaeota archaeon]HIH33955.1 hypothetical protein [Nanoarchaeota archaeon]HIH51754.1 hypothetical protein [Nanoarchaeota archaeon]